VVAYLQQPRRHRLPAPAPHPAVGGTDQHPHPRADGHLHAHADGAIPTRLPVGGHHRCGDHAGDPGPDEYGAAGRRQKDRGARASEGRRWQGGRARRARLRVLSLQWVWSCLQSDQRRRHDDRAGQPGPGCARPHPEFCHSRPICHRLGPALRARVAACGRHLLGHRRAAGEPLAQLRQRPGHAPSAGGHELHHQRHHLHPAQRRLRQCPVMVPLRLPGRQPDQQLDHRHVNPNSKPAHLLHGGPATGHDQGTRSGQQDHHLGHALLRPRVPGAAGQLLHGGLRLRLRHHIRPHRAGHSSLGHRRLIRRLVHRSRDRPPVRALPSWRVQRHTGHRPALRHVSLPERGDRRDGH